MSTVVKGSLIAAVAVLALPAAAQANSITCGASSKLADPIACYAENVANSTDDLLTLNLSGSWVSRNELESREVAVAPEPDLSGEFGGWAQAMGAWEPFEPISFQPDPIQFVIPEPEPEVLAAPQPALVPAPAPEPDPILPPAIVYNFVPQPPGGSFVIPDPDPVFSNNPATPPGAAAPVQNIQNPEPASMLLLGTGLVFLAARLRRRRTLA